jgi:iron complex outermembrane receptor protein
MMRQILLLLCLFLPVIIFSQTKGKVIDSETNEPIVGAKIVSSTGEKKMSDANGDFQLSTSTVPFTVIVSMPTFLTDTVQVQRDTILVIRLEVELKKIDAVVVTASRRSQRIEDVPISMEILKPALINNKGITDLEQAVDQSPGVYAMDGQVSIRGGGGYSYGAGSRVLLLWNGIPMMSPDVGDAKWNSIPMENASQIEIIKGASSVLYGSGALNGIISLNEMEPDKKGTFSAKIQSGIYCDPKRESLKWWTKNPTFHMFDVYYGKMKNRFGYTLSANGFTNQGFRKGEVDRKSVV